MNRYSCGQQKVARNDANEVPLHGQVYHSIVCTVAGDDARRRKSGVNGKLVQRIKTIGGGFTSKRFNVFPVFVETMNVVAGISVGYVNITIRGDSQRS